MTVADVFVRSAQHNSGSAQGQQRERALSPRAHETNEPCALTGAHGVSFSPRARDQRPAPRHALRWPLVFERLALPSGSPALRCESARPRHARRSSEPVALVGKRVASVVGDVLASCRDQLDDVEQHAVRSGGHEVPLAPGLVAQRLYDLEPRRVQSLELLCRIGYLQGQQHRLGCRAENVGHAWVRLLAGRQRRIDQLDVPVALERRLEAEVFGSERGAGFDVAGE